MRPVLCLVLAFGPLGALGSEQINGTGLEEQNTTDAYSILESVFPQYLLEEQHPLQFVNSEAAPRSQRLYANRFFTIGELSDAIFGDVELVKSFDPSTPRNYNMYNGDAAQNSTVRELTEDITTNMVPRLYKAYRELKNIMSILDQMTVEDFIELHDSVFDGVSQSSFNSSMEPYMADFDAIQSQVKWANIELSDAENHSSFIPFLNEEVDYPQPGEVNSEFFFLSLIKLPFTIISIVFKVFWKLVQLAKLIEIAELKICLLIIDILEKICSVVFSIKKKICSILELAAPSIPFWYKVIVVIVYIVKKLEMVMKDLEQLLFEFKFRLILLFQKSERKSLLIAVYLKELVYGKLKISQSIKAENHMEFINSDDSFRDWDDFVYFAEFSKYIYPVPGVHKSEINGLDSIVKEALIKISNENLKRDRNGSDWLVRFDMKDDYSFDSFEFNRTKFEEFFKRPQIINGNLLGNLTII